MGEASKIEWCHHTFNPWIGCAKVSPGCTNCYASVETFPRVQRSKGIELWGPKAARHVTSDANWKQPYRWNKAAKAAGERHRVFCASLSDIAERPEGPMLAILDTARARLWPMIEECAQLDWLLLTKRPENLLEVVPAHWRKGFPDNVWPMTTAEDQQRADERIPLLLQIPAAVHGVSLEPLLGPIDLTLRGLPDWDEDWKYDTLRGLEWASPRDDDEPASPKLDWVIVGGESGPGARPCDVEWIRSIVRQCKEAGVPAFVKQLGALPTWTLEPGLTIDVRAVHAAAGQPLVDRKGGDISEFPPELRVRQWPEVRP